MAHAELYCPVERFSDVASSSRLTDAVPAPNLVVNGLQALGHHVRRNRNCEGRKGRPKQVEQHGPPRLLATHCTEQPLGFLDLSRVHEVLAEVLSHVLAELKLRFELLAADELLLLFPDALAAKLTSCRGLADGL